MQKNEPQQYLTPYIKINLKWIIDFNKTIKLQKENKGENFNDLGFGKDFLNTKSMNYKRKISANWTSSIS